MRVNGTFGQQSFGSRFLLACTRLESNASQTTSGASSHTLELCKPLSTRSASNILLHALNLNLLPRTCFTAASLFNNGNNLDRSLLRNTTPKRRGESHLLTGREWTNWPGWLLCNIMHKGNNGDTQIRELAQSRKTRSFPRRPTNTHGRQRAKRLSKSLSSSSSSSRSKSSLSTLSDDATARKRSRMLPRKVVPMLQVCVCPKTSSKPSKHVSEGNKGRKRAFKQRKRNRG